jgi:hypothetical protein
MPTVDRAAPLRFLTTAFRPDDGIAVLLKSYDSGRTMQRVGPVAMVADARFQAWLRFQNAQRFNVYVSVNAIRPGRRSRTREAICAIRHVFLDADQDGPQVLAAVAARSDLPPPSYVLQSSPGRVHIFWRVEGFDVQQLEALQKHLARVAHGPGRHVGVADDTAAGILLFEITCCQDLPYHSDFSRPHVCGGNT